MKQSPLSNLDRVAVIGTSCSGKTTLARTLATTLDMPHIELDAIHWQPNWRSRPLAEFRQLTQAAVAAERWVLDGNYSKVRDIVWQRATALVWLNYPFRVVLWRALFRTIGRVLTQEELFAGNRKGFRKSFLSKDSILVWVITTYQRRRRDYPELFKRPEHAHLEVIELGLPGEAEQLVAGLNVTVNLALLLSPTRYDALSTVIGN
jgi:adenylate kinase family enzyme